MRFSTALAAVLVASLSAAVGCVRPGFDDADLTVNLIETDDDREVFVSIGLRDRVEDCPTAADDAVTVGDRVLPLQRTGGDGTDLFIRECLAVEGFDTYGRDADDGVSGDIAFSDDVVRTAHVAALDARHDVAFVGDAEDGVVVAGDRVAIDVGARDDVIVDSPSATTVTLGGVAVEDVAVDGDVLAFTVPASVSGTVDVGVSVLVEGVEGCDGFADCTFSGQIERRLSLVVEPR